LDAPYRVFAWDELRKQVGYNRFWPIVRAWPHVHAYRNSDSVSYSDWIRTS